MLTSISALFDRQGAIRLGEDDHTEGNEKLSLPTRLPATTEPSVECSQRRLLCESLLASIWIIFCRELVATDPSADNYLLYRRLINVILTVPVLAGCGTAAAVLQAKQIAGTFQRILCWIGGTLAFALPWGLVVHETLATSRETCIVACFAVGLIQLSLVLP
ncbi:hypothetical protein RHOSPDRAFT_36069 [Rhodotorula sp. JG-1b]|nr:hypothetical protein RHOSPDRAFT_36069 [Rhodotorula sp. JG-1b]